MKKQFVLVMVLTLFTWQYAVAHYEDTGLISFTQPDGTSFVGRGWGDEFEFQWETQDGYRFVMNYINGFWSYATLNELGDYAPTDYLVGKDDPNAAGIVKHLLRSAAWQEACRAKREAFERILENIRNQRHGINGAGKSVSGSSIQSTNIQIDAILVEFADVKHDPQYSLTDFNNMMTSVDTYTGQGSNTPHPQDKPVYGSLRDYWDDMSNGNVNFTGGVWNASGGTINWVVLDHNKSEYHAGTYNFRSEVLTKSAYPHTPGPNRIRVMIYAGNQYLNGSLHPGSVGYEYIDSEEFSRPQTQENIGNFFNNIGTACHEMGHAAFGFPDRYGTYNTLQWDLMGIGNKNGPDNELACPATLNPFDRKSESWISFQSFSGTQAAKPFAYNYSSPQIFQVAVSGNEYFLVENRRNESGGGGTFDKWLLAQGILVWHVRNSSGAGTINLIEADNTQTDVTQSGDPFPGSSNNTNLDDFTTPNVKYTNATNSNVLLHYISSPSATMTADFGTKWFGNLPLNLTWSGTVKVGGNMIVPNSKTLTVSSNTVVNFDVGTGLTVDGVLTANSTSSSQRITFTGTTATPGSWNGIKINSGSSTNVSTLQRCDVTYAATGITITYTGNSNNVTIKKCRLSNNLSHGINVNGRTFQEEIVTFMNFC
jgi:hypothetical protein